MKTGRYSLKELLTHSEIEQIIIPEIQRDYVWEEDNVTKLLDDIILKFNQKQNHSLEIKINGIVETNVSVNQFLTKEYERLKHHQKLGFIYAYHDKEYAGKFFLIDGQQRLTTLFLLLLNLYCDIPEKKETFRTFYCNNSILKLDYKVREQSHDFLKLFVNEVIVGNDYRNSEKFYSTEYLKDATIVSLIRNYEVISHYLHNNSKKEDLLEYIEDFIEINYFDTHLSEQGEQLYIYMNSRGEQLSFQEIVRAEMMKKIGSAVGKIELGKAWESWQNYFWIHRGENENADSGFEEFLKWTVIIHISANDNAEIENFTDKEKDYKRKELKEQFVRQFSDTSKQKNAIINYLSSYVDADFLSQLFKVVSFVFSIKSKYLPLKKEWLSTKSKVIDYVTLLPVLNYCLKNNFDNDMAHIQQIERMAMFLKNITYFEAIAKNPDTFVIDLIVVTNQLYGDRSDVTGILELIDVSTSIRTDNEIGKLRLLKNSLVEERIRWEHFFWDITLEDKFCEFLMGESSVLLKCIDIDATTSVEEKIQLLEQYKIIIKQVIFNKKDTNKLRRFLLSFYDFSLSSGTGNGIDKYSLIGVGNGWDVLREWREVFKSVDFIDVLNWIHSKKELDLDVLLIQAINLNQTKDYREALIKYPALLKYCSNNKFLYQNEERVVLLKQTNYGVQASKEIQCALLEASYPNKVMWIADNNCSVLDFTFDSVSKQIIFNKPLEGEYALDFVYNPSLKSWTFSLFKRASEISEDFGHPQENWIVKNNRLTLDKEAIYNYDNKLSLIDNNNKMIKVIDDVVFQSLNLIKVIAK